MREQIGRRGNNFLAWEAPRHNGGIPDDSHAPVDKFAGTPNGWTRGEARFPGERLTDQQRDDVLSGVLNSESKALVLAGMVVQGGTFSSSKLHRMILTMQRGQHGWDINRRVPYMYCVNSFAGIGLVAKDEISGDRRTLDYKATPRGRDTLPVLGHLLRFSLDHPDVSLEQAFATTAVSNAKKGGDSEVSAEGDFKNRAPKTRLRIFQTLLQAEGSLRAIDVQQAIGSSHTLYTHLENLHNAGLITFKKTEAEGRDYIIYTIPQGAIPDHDVLVPNKTYRDHSLAARTRYIISKLAGEISASDLYAKLLQLFPQYAKRDARSVRDNIMGDLNLLANHGYIEKGQLTGVKQTDVSLTDAQREKVSALVGIIDGFQEGDPEFLAEGAQRAREIISDPEVVATLMLKAQRNSSAATAIGPEVLKERILAYVQGSDTLVQGELVAAHLGNDIGTTYAASLLRELEKAGKLRRVRRNKAAWYGPIEQPEAAVALPDDVAGLQAAEVAVAEEFAPYAKGLKLLLAAHATHADPESEEARAIMSHISTIRSNPAYRELVERRDAVQEKLAVIEAEGSVTEGEPKDEGLGEGGYDQMEIMSVADAETDEMRLRIEAFRALGVEDPEEIAEWMDVSVDDVKRVLMEDVREVQPLRITHPRVDVPIAKETTLFDAADEGPEPVVRGSFDGSIDDLEAANERARNQVGPRPQRTHRIS